MLPEVGSADVRPCLQLRCHSLCKYILHWVSWVKIVQPEVLVDWNPTRGVKVIFCWGTTAIELVGSPNNKLCESTYLAYASQYPVVFR